MPRLRPIAVVLAALGAALAGACTNPFVPVRAPEMCPQAEIQCLQPYGHNWQKCGALADRLGAPEEFLLCPAADGYACVPCGFVTVAETRARCQASFGPDCRNFVEQNAHWDGDLGRFSWPSNSLSYRLFGAGPH